MYKHKSGLMFRTKPWKHQIKALQYLYTRNCGALYTTMGTGKTKVMIDLINNRDFKCVLIICPLNVCGVWVNQFKIHSVNQNINVVNLSNYSSNEKVTLLTKTLANPAKNTVFIVNYDSVWREPFRAKVLKTPFDCIICDESHRIKTPSSKVSSFMALLGKRCPNRYLMTGTPIAQEPSDIYAQYKFLEPSIFGTNIDRFRERYENLDIWRTSEVGYRVLDEDNPYKNTEELHNKMFSIAVNVESDLVLPEYNDIFIDVKLNGEVNRIDQELRKTAVHSDAEWFLNVQNVLALQVRLQQLTSGFVQLEDFDKNKKLKKVDDSKQKALKELLTDMSPTEPVVIFARFRADIDNIKEVLNKLNRSYSEVSGETRELEEWVGGTTTDLIVQIQSGAEGIDLTRARYAVYYSQTRALSQYLQSRKRLHRPGQVRPVTYYHLVGKLNRGHSIDERIYMAHEANESVIKAIMRDGLI